MTKIKFDIVRDAFYSDDNNEEEKLDDSYRALEIELFNDDVNNREDKLKVLQSRLTAEGFIGVPLQRRQFLIKLLRAG